MAQYAASFMSPNNSGFSTIDQHGEPSGELFVSDRRPHADALDGALCAQGAETCEPGIDLDAIL